MNDRLNSLEDSRDSNGVRSKSLQERTSRQTNSRNSNKLHYLHEVGLLENNSHTAELNASIRRQLGLKSNPQIMPQSVRSTLSRGRALSIQNQQGTKPPSPPRKIDYNKWYIDPKLRYLRKQENPKNNIRAYANQQFIYRNLHNQYFWDWQHPFDKVQKHQNNELSSKALALQTDELSKNKGNLRVLEEFRKKLEDNRARLPLIVKQMLEFEE